MKKLFVIFAAVALVWAFAAPASAVDWNFYGSARMATYWNSSDGGKEMVGGVKRNASDDSDLQWEGQNNSRIGATVKGENVSGRFELGFTGKDGSDWDPPDVQVRARRLQGNWNFGAGTLEVGKGYTSFNQFISGQVGKGDAGLLGTGFMYAFRPYFIGLRFGGFAVQLIDPEQNDDIVGGDLDFYLPKIEANWGMAFDTFSFNIRGGFQTYEVNSVPVGAGTEDVTVDSYGIGGDGNFNFGPVRLGFGISYTQNGGNAGWTAGGGTWDLDDDIDDMDTIQAGIVGNFKMSDMVSFEAGFGYRNDDLDVSGNDDVTTWELYVNSVIALAPGVYIIPEFAYRDLDDDAFGVDRGNDYYLGGKWQIDF